ncbi:NAD(P)-binding protein [Polyplosphaeria fusca]|uniref:NAD(P)-binding protein n=1 Tax=Polyplosphaeria fusca TaxID=682080 RepID=A0A9P4QHL7_9PLEO|nr:NAD(P)-binding protein [Polyplosphaeria fusca]
MAHPNRLQNAHVLVFGGTSGIGFAIASLVLSQGATVTISGSAQPKVDSKVALLQSYYPTLPASHVRGYACDLRDKANLESNLTSVFDKATSSGTHKIDHIAFTAGDLADVPKIPEVTADNVMVGQTVRYVACLLIAKLLHGGKYMPASPSSSFTMTGGVNTHKPMPGWSVQASWGGSIVAMARGLAVDLKPIRVNVVEPGAIHTELLQVFVEQVPGILDAFKTQTLTGTVGEPSDCAEAYAWFMKDRFANGTVAPTNGGQLLAPYPMPGFS